MNYTLISSERSPFGRACRMLMHAHQIPFQFRILNFVDEPQAAVALAQESPINKVPILIVEGSQRIFDSRVIAQYLTDKHGLRRFSLDEENILSAIYSCLDVSVSLFLMRANGYDIQASNHYLQRQRERIPRNLAFIEPWIHTLSPDNSFDWNYASMCLLSFLYWADVRARTIRLEELPSFQNFMEKFAHAPGVKETVFR